MIVLTQDQITKMSIPELKKNIKEISLTLRDLRMQLVTRQSQDHKTYANAKKNRSQLLTELAAKEKLEQAK